MSYITNLVAVSFRNMKVIIGFLEDSPVLLVFSLLALCVLFTQKFRDFFTCHTKCQAWKEEQTAVPFFLRSQHTHNTRREMPVTQGLSSQVLFSYD